MEIPDAVVSPARRYAWRKVPVRVVRRVASMVVKGATLGGLSKGEIYDAANRDPSRRGYEFDAQLFCHLMDTAARTYPVLEQHFEAAWRRELILAKGRFNAKND